MFLRVGLAARDSALLSGFVLRKDKNVVLVCVSFLLFVVVSLRLTQSVVYREREAMCGQCQCFLYIFPPMSFSPSSAFASILQNQQHLTVLLTLIFRF